jgi:hypothetical protein
MNGPVVHGVTGHTTAKVTSQHGLIYDRLHSRFGADAARTDGEANEAALDWIARSYATLSRIAGRRRRAC